MIPAEVLIYIQSIRVFFNKNQELKKYFINDNNEELFFEKITEYSENKYINEGEVMLTQVEFEEIRKQISNKKNKSELFLNLPNFGYICLN